MAEREIWNILVVDDNKNNLFVLGSVLRGAGYRIAAALSGLEAIDLLKDNRFDLILLDIRMPGIDGIETCRRLMADPATKDIPVLFISAVEDKDLIVSAFAAGGKDYIGKPFEQRELLARVETQFEILRAKRELEELNRGLEIKVEERTKELREKTVRLEAALEERAVLLQEIYHRVNNNLQFVKGLLFIDRPDAMGKMAEAFIDKFESRIHTMAYVHELMYQSENLTHVDMGVYLQSIFLFNMEKHGRAPGSCGLELKNGRFLLDINHAVPCGMVLNELIRPVTAAAGPDVSGRIIADFKHEAGKYEVLFAVDGSIGKLSAARLSGTDLEIAEAIAEEQLFGKLDNIETQNCAFSLSFPERKLSTFHDVSSLVDSTN